jgi:ribosomal protein S18 acetylase RimI-like enzyme
VRPAEFTRLPCNADPVTSIPKSGTIRAARAQDRAAIIDVVRASGLLPPDALTEVEATLDGFLTGAAATDRWLITDTGTSIAATAYYAPERMTDGTWNLYLLAVHPDHQGQGRGAALVRHVEQDLREAGARVLLIETSGVPDFAGQRAFYTGLGYHEEARIRDFYEPGDDKVIYWKILLAAT